MKVGDYVRTSDRGIRKIDEWKDDIFYRDTQGRINTKDNVIKSRPDIIDLIEVGDLMLIDISPDDCGGIVVPRIAETQAELDRFVGKIQKGEYILKGILTKERIESQAYWL